MDDDMYGGFESISGSSRSKMSSVASPQSTTSVRSDVSDSRTFVVPRPASSMASARNIASARPLSSQNSARLLTAIPSTPSSVRGNHHHGEVTFEQESVDLQVAVESAWLDSVCLGADGKIDEALEKSKKAARFCNRLQHQTTELHHGDEHHPSLSCLTFKVTFHYGHMLALAGKFRQAEKIFLNLLRQNIDDEGKQTTVNISLATLYQENGDFDKALQIWLTLFDDNVFADGSERDFLVGQLTTCYVALGRFDLAFKYNEIIAETNDNHEAAFHRLLFLVKKEATWEKIEEAYQKLLRVRCSHCSPPSSDSSTCKEIIKSATQLMLSMTASSEWIDDELTRSSWQSVAVEMELQRCFDLLENGEVQQVLEKFADFDCLDLDSDVLFEVSTLLCWIHYQLGHFVQCLEHANKAREALPENPTGQLNLGCAHFAMENYDTALQYLSGPTTENSPLNEKRLLYRALTLKALGRNDEALSTMLSLAQPWSTDIALEISEMQSLQGDTTTALHTLLDVRVEHETNITLLRRIGSLAAMLGDDDTAAWHYNHAHRLDPTDLATIDWLARYSVERDAPEKAVELYAEASRIEPGNPKWRVLMATALRRAARLTEAFDLCLKIHEEYPGDISCLQLLLNLCRKLQIPAHQVLQYRAKLDALEEQQRQLEEAQHAAGDLLRIQSPTPSLFSRMSLARPGSCMSLRPVSSVASGGTFVGLNDIFSVSVKGSLAGSKSTLTETAGKHEELDLSIEDLLPPY